MNKTYKTSLRAIMIGITFVFFLISLGVILAINFRTLYYYDIHTLNITGLSGLSEDIIRTNYDALIDYCSPFHRGPLVFPTLPSSPQALQHFVEVKRIFVALYWILLISLLLLIVLTYRMYKKKEYHDLKLSAVITLVLPTIVGLACSINFNRTFLLFHKLFFRNDYWMFDPVTDPIINLLPSEYFLHCAILIVAVLFLGALLQYVCYRILTTVAPPVSTTSPPRIIRQTPKRR